MSVNCMFLPEIKKFLGSKSGGNSTDEWASKEVHSLIKKLKGKRGAIEDLEEALANPEQPSNCVTIPRGPDCMQVLRQRQHPHVVYCKIWRWPTLCSRYELKSSGICQFPYWETHEEVCINPYHYEKLEAPKLPPVLVPPYTDCGSGFLASSLLESFQEVAVPKNISVTKHGFVSSPMAVNSQGSYQAISLTGSSSISLSQLRLQLPAHSPQLERIPAGTPPPPYSEDDAILGAVARDTTINGTPISFQEQQSWCSIAYYEFNNRVGNTFHATSLSTIIDGTGFSDSSGDNGRFSLGMVPNINRSSASEKTRSHLGSGVHLYYVGGEVFVECLSAASIFVQSRSCNYMNGLDFSTVRKVPPSCSLKIFNNQEFFNLLTQNVTNGYGAVHDLTTMCKIRLSFVKGWGIEYRLQDVTSTPCWIDITLRGPLQWLEDVLRQMRTQ